MIDSRVIPDVVVILSTITLYGFTERWFILWLLYCLPLLLKVFDRGMVHDVVVILSAITV